MAKKTAHKKTKKSSAKKSYKTSDALSKSALKLIDQAAVLLKQGVVVASKEGIKSRKILKRKASTWIDIALKRLNSGIAQGSEMIRKGIKKL